MDNPDGFRTLQSYDRTSHRGNPQRCYTFTCGPWCQGVSLHRCEFFKNSDLKDLGHNSVDYIHIITEVIKLALSDREHYLGDPEFVDVPLKKLLSNDYGEERYSMIKQKAVLSEEYLWGDDATFGETNEFSLDTSYMCAVDKDGLVASVTPSDGSANTPVLPGWALTHRLEGHNRGPSEPPIQCFHGNDHGLPPTRLLLY